MDSTLVENDDAKSIEERDSDGAEVEREGEEEKKEALEEAGIKEVVKEVGLEEESVVETIVEEVEKVFETVVKEVEPKVASITEVNDDDSAIKQSLVGDPPCGNGISNGISLDEDDVAVEKEEAVAEEIKELGGWNDNSLSESGLDSGVIEPAEYLPKEVIVVPPGASFNEVLYLIEEKIVDNELVKQSVPPLEEVNFIIGNGPAETSDVADGVGPTWKENGIEVLDYSAGKDELPSVPTVLLLEETESEASLIVVQDDISSFTAVGLSENCNGDKLPEYSSIDASAVVDEVKVPEIFEQLEGEGVAAILDTNNGVDVVEELKTQELSEVKVDSLANPVEKDELPSVPTVLLLEETESEASLIVVQDDISSFTAVGLSENCNGDKLPEYSSIDASAVVDEVKVPEIYEQLEGEGVAAILDTNNGVDVVEELKTQELSEVKVDSLSNPAEKDELPSVPTVLLLEETESEASLIVVQDDISSFTAVGLSENGNGDKLPEYSSIDASAVVDEVKVPEIYEQIEGERVAAILDTNNGVDVVEELKTQEPSEVKVDSLANPAEKDELPSVPTVLLLEETESEASLIVVQDDISSFTAVGLSENGNGDKLPEYSSVDASAVVDEVKVPEIYEKSEGERGSAILDTNNGVDVVEELKTQELSEVKVDSRAVDTSHKTDNGAVLINQTAEQSGAPATVPSHEVAHVKNSEVLDKSEAQPLIPSAAQAVQRASWRNCCGLFELFVRADR
ncbi:hypothetical protein Dimus_021999 [Dionaea muscipula]